MAKTTASANPYANYDGDDLQAAVRTVERDIQLYWRWVHYAEFDGAEFSGNSLINHMDEVAAIIREFQRRASKGDTGWEL